ncbi:ABC transporter ATP-binding protein [Methanosarcina vacuolata]|uniref:Duplicated ATPase component of energizing module of predicted tryptophan ECF transporter n=1 Tax=Methanosarcina vacuolata Z-761 TaxID=1434123 RepID=A0A0E3Q6E2_9EURY|nr:ABC transporter ATP-binding protein [Methanosarcina vacuolata]AKB44324.1 Duplicated ATPase component of energizing module of predicted tryptophan ECF transporter [Methanosarcina vacuolata Z-761]
MIVLKDFSYTYRTAETPVLNKINLEVRQGELLLVTGHSAAGKTTLALAMAGILHHEIGGKTEGEIIFKNRNVKSFNGMKELSRHIGMVFDDAESQLIFTSVEEEIRSGLENRGYSKKELMNRLEEVMELCEISHLKTRAPHTLSGGQKQKAALAATLALDTEVLILDEATAELDTKAVRRIFSILKRLKEAGKTIIIIDHNIDDFLEIGDRVVLLEKGRIKAIKSPADFSASSLTASSLTASSLTASSLTASSLTESSLASEQEISETDRQAHYISQNKGKEMQPIISVRNLTQRYGEVLALDSIDLEIYPGELVAVLGENGSGKTTLVKHFNGLLHPYSGSVIIKGLETSKTPVNELVKHTGLVFQNPDNMLFEDTVEAEIAFGLNNINIKGLEAEKAISDSLELVNLGEKLKVFPRNLSRGERQRLAVACVIAMKPELIVLDEPTTGLDAEESDSMMQLMRKLQQEGHTIVMVTHNMQIVKDHAERIIRMEAGKIVEDTRRGTAGREQMNSEQVSREHGGICA